MHVACIDIGTVTCRLALADVDGATVTRLTKESRICNLGEGLSETNLLSQSARARVTACCKDFLATVHASPAQAICCTLTSAARDADNSDELVGALREMGLDPQVIPGEVEGRLTFLGVAQDFPGRRIMIADNGGGSTELAVGRLDGGVPHVDYVTSVDVGCRRVTERFLSRQDPPSSDDLAQAHDFAARLFAPAAEKIASLGERPEVAAICGGTATSLVAMSLGLEPYDSSVVHLHALDRATVAHLEERLAAMNEAARAKVVGLQPKRAPVILGGAIAVYELMRAVGVDSLTVSESDLLYGLSISVAVAARAEKSLVAWSPPVTNLR